MRPVMPLDKIISWTWVYVDGTREDSRTTVGGKLTRVGPIAQRWLDNDAPVVCGLPWMYSEKRYGKLRDAAYIHEHIERIRSLPTREGGV